MLPSRPREESLERLVDPLREGRLSETLGSSASFTGASVDDTSMTRGSLNCGLP